MKFYTKPVLTNMHLVQTEAIAGTPWADLTQGGQILDSAVSSHNAQKSGSVMGGNGQ